MRAFLFDPCLGTMTGHWENFCRRFYDAFTARGMECRIFCQAETKPEIVGGLSVIPTFTRSPFIDANDPEAFAEECEFFAHDFDRIDPAQFRDGDLLIFPTIFPQVLKPMMQWLKKVITQAEVSSAIVFQFEAGFEKNKVSLIRRIKGRLRHTQDLTFNPANKMPRGVSWAYTPMIGNYLTIAPEMKATRKDPHFRYFASSTELAHNFSRLFDISVTALPMPAPAVDAAHADKQDGIIKIGYFGHASLEKGAQFLEPVIDKILRSVSNAEFHLHVNPNKDTIKILAPFQKVRERVHCVHGHISQDALLSMMKGVDIVLMPYQPAKYRTVPSAVFTECMSMGKVMVIPADTWISDEARVVNAGCMIFNEYTAEEIAKALLAAIEKFPALKKQSEEAAVRFRARHGIARCMDIILQKAA